MATDADLRPIVFVSYSHKDENWKDRLRPHLEALQQARSIIIWDDRKIDPGGEWFAEIQKIMDEAAVSLCLISSHYLASNFCAKIEVPYLLERQQKEGMFLIPVLIRQCDWQAFEWLESRQIIPRDGKSVAEDFQGKEDGVFADVARYIRRIISDPQCRPSPPPPSYQPPEKITVERLPVTGAELYGRQTELEQLDRDWKSGSTHVVSLVAWGGVGKSTLVNKWRERMAADNYRGAQRVYAWSFYSQGVGERATSADQFINDALEWFGDPDPTRVDSPWGKGERLAHLIRSKKTLLLLDGLEPLQHSFADQYGKLKDPALSTLITELAQENPGLCVITTRVMVPELVPFTESARQENLEQISTEAGRALLRLGGVRGTDLELENASREFGNHALALNLLAVYLHEIPGHHISGASQIPPLGLTEAEGEHPRRVMAAFERRFGEGAEVELLRMLGLFDRPADRRAMDTLRAEPPVPGLNVHIQKLSEVEWLLLIRRLRKLRLVAEESQHELDTLDAHPLIREHFGRQLRRDHPDAWREGNNRLYEHFKQRPKELPESIQEMEPLLMAVGYGCNAGRHRDALHEVYLPRIMRGNQSYAARKLGARSALLSALTYFVEGGDWGRPVPPQPPHCQGLEPRDQLTVLMHAGLLLTTTRGYASNEAMACYRRVQELCAQLGETALLYSVSINHWRYSLVTNNLMTTQELAKEVYHLTQDLHDLALTVGAYRALSTSAYFRGTFEPAQKYAQQGIDLWYSQEEIPTEVEEVTAPIVTCLAIEAMVRWQRGFPEQARAQVHKAVSVARDLSDMNALSVALFLTSYINQFCRLPEEAMKSTRELIEVCEAQGIVLWLAAGKVVRGWALAALGQIRDGLLLIDQGMRNWRQTGAETSVQYFLYLKAETLIRLGRSKEALALLEEAEAFANKLNEHWWLCELYRMKGEILLRENAPPDLAEWSFDLALNVARSKGSRSLELRAALSIGRLWRKQGKGREAQLLVEGVYKQFKEGFDLADLLEAKSFIEGGE
jgi:tetratricopeptide (TPR) repeat protein